MGLAPAVPGSSAGLALRALRALVAVGIALVTGFVELSNLFGDFMLESPRWQYWLAVGGQLVLGGFLVGLLVPRLWALAALCSWGSVALAPFGLQATWLGRGDPWPSALGGAAVLAIVLPAVACAGALAGSKLSGSRN